MANPRLCFVVVISGLAACGDDGGNSPADAMPDSAPDAKIFNDAPPPMFDLACTSNTTPPTSAAAMITLSGTATQFTFANMMFTQTPLGTALIRACANAACSANDGTDTTDASGDFSIGPFSTGGTPQNDYLELTKSGYRTTLTYPFSPFVANVSGIPMFTMTTTLAGLLANLNCDASMALVGVAVTDCADMPITDTTNVTVTLKQGGTVVQNTTQIDLGTLDPNAAGTFLICSVPANAATEVSATYKTTPLMAHSVKTVAGQTTATQLRPGF